MRGVCTNLNVWRQQWQMACENTGLWCVVLWKRTLPFTDPPYRGMSSQFVLSEFIFVPLCSSLLCTHSLPLRPSGTPDPSVSLPHFLEFLCNRELAGLEDGIPVNILVLPGSSHWFISVQQAFHVLLNASSTGLSAERCEYKHIFFLTKLTGASLSVLGPATPSHARLAFLLNWRHKG